MVPFPLQYIVLFVAKVLMGQVHEVNDVREYDVEDSKKTTAGKKKESGLQLPNALKEGCVGRGGDMGSTSGLGEGKMPWSSIQSIHRWAGKEKDVLMQSVKNSCRDQEELCVSTSQHCGVSVHLCPTNPHLSLPLLTSRTGSVCDIAP